VPPRRACGTLASLGIPHSTQGLSGASVPNTTQHSSTTLLECDQRMNFLDLVSAMDETSLWIFSVKSRAHFAMRALVT
jgi:hypothetical protein